jgi:hypothetical protein
VKYIVGSSTEAAVVEDIRRRVSERQPEHVLVFLDSDPLTRPRREGTCPYADFVGIGDYMCAQDGCIDELRMLRGGWRGPPKGDRIVPSIRLTLRGRRGALGPIPREPQPEGLATPGAVNHPPPSISYQLSRASGLQTGPLLRPDMATDEGWWRGTGS